MYKGKTIRVHEGIDRLKRIIREEAHPRAISFNESIENLIGGAEAAVALARKA